MMQLSEYLIWKDQNCGKINKIGTKLAMFFNLTQPIIVYIVLMMITKKSYNISNNKNPQKLHIFLENKLEQ